MSMHVTGSSKGDPLLHIYSPRYLHVPEYKLVKHCYVGAGLENVTVVQISRINDIAVEDFEFGVNAIHKKMFDIRSRSLRILLADVYIDIINFCFKEISVV